MFHASLRILLLLATVHASCIQAAEKQMQWRDGQLLLVQPDGSFTDSLADAPKPLAVGWAALENLKVNRGLHAAENGGEYWIVSATAVSTNAGGPNQGESVYVGFDREFCRLIAMSNLNGEVRFRVSSFQLKDGRRVLPNRIYVGGSPDSQPGRPGVHALVRVYRLQPTE